MLAFGVTLAVVVLPDVLALGIKDSALEHDPVDVLKREPVAIGVQAKIRHCLYSPLDLNRDQVCSARPLEDDLPSYVRPRWDHQL